jgi:threonine dehydrogenase-like Zn-dependent dehydrogenase
MRAVRSQAGQIKVVDVPSPDGEGVRVRVASAGICGSDLHLLKGLESVPLDSMEGFTLGHEIAGVTEDGTPVAVEPLSPCQHCEFCERGDYNLCTSGPAMIHGIARDGGMADEMLVPKQAVVPLPVGIDPKDACLVEPLGIAVHGLRRAGLRGGERVAVIGGGNIGLCAVAAVRAGGGDVALVARHDAQREAGARLGAMEAEGQYDLVIEAAGSESALEAAVDWAKPGGRISIMGSYWTPVTLPGMQMSLKEVNLIPASLYGRTGAVRDIEVATSVLAANPEIPRTLITHRFPLEAAADAFAAAADRSAGAIKVVIEP